MFEPLYNSLLNFEKKVETGLALAFEDSNLGMAEKIKSYIRTSVSDEVKKFKENANFIKLGRNIL